MGNTMPAMYVFSEVIRFLKDHFMNTLKQMMHGFSEDDIKWVLTVPAIWDDAAKQFMRKVAETVCNNLFNFLMAISCIK